MSASIWPPVSLRDSSKAAFYLKHVGFLGGSAPSVKGLGVAPFGENDASEAFVVEHGQTLRERAKFLKGMWPAMPVDTALSFCEQEVAVMALPYDPESHRRLVAALGFFRRAYAPK